MEDRPVTTPRLAWEPLLVLLVFAAAVALRLPTVSGPFDRELEGFQGSAFTAMAVNFERLGVDAYGGYGVMNAELPTDADATPYLYANHPPTTNLLVWASLKLLGPDGWSERWREARPPTEGFETAVRLPFFLAHLASLVALWWAVRVAAGPRRALLALGVLAALPISILYASLVNYENLYLPWTLAAVGTHVLWLRTGRARWLLGTSALLALAGAITFGPAFFVAPLVAHTLLVGGFRKAFVEGAAASVGVLTPLALHAAWVRASLPAAPAEGVFARVRNLVEPAFDGSMPVGDWLLRNATRATHFSSSLLFGLAFAGAVLSLAGWLRGRRADEPAPVEPGWILGGGAALLFVGFYRHTFDGVGLYDSQTVFLVNLGPAIACFAALALERLGAFARRHGTWVSLALLVVVGTLAQGRTREVARRWRAPGPNDDPPVAGGPADPLPATHGPRIAEVLPARSIGLVPREMALTPATSLYAWRTLVPVDRETFPLSIAVVRDMYGLGDLPRYLVLPLDPPERARAAVERERASMIAQGRQPIATSEHWEAWPLQGN